MNFYAKILGLMLIFTEFPCQEIPQTLVILTHKSTNISFSCALNSKPFGPAPRILLFPSFYVKKKKPLCISVLLSAQSQDGLGHAH